MTARIYTIIGDPVPLARPRMSGPNRIIYDSQKLIKHQLIHQLINQRGDLPLLSGPCHLDATFYMRMPQASMKKAKENIGKPHIFRPDLDNLIKFVNDLACMEDFDDKKGILLRDDCIISSITARKVYDLEPRTVFTITELKNG
jgi:Holliday junction resolvase RusA-like endonuclease